MGNANKDKGAAAERASCDYLNLRGIEAERVPAGATLDRGDLWIPDKNWPAVQVKNHARLDLSGWVDDVAIQAANANETPTTITNATLPGDTRRLRGIPCIARGVGGTSPNTNPLTETIARETRNIRRPGVNS